MFGLREVHFWVGFCLLCCFAAMLVLFNPGIGEYSPLWVEIAGTTLGVALVISLERATRLAVDIGRGRELETDLGQELITCLLILRNNPLEKVGIDFWEMAKSTGDFSFISSEARQQFQGIYKVIKYYNELVGRYQLAQIIPNVSETQLDELRGSVENYSNTLVGQITNALEQVFGPTFRELLDESLNE